MFSRISFALNDYQAIPRSLAEKLVERRSSHLCWMESQFRLSRFSPAAGGIKNAKNPRQFPAGGLGGQVVRPNLPVALSAEQHADGALILQLVGGTRLCHE